MDGRDVAAGVARWFVWFIFMVAVVMVAIGFLAGRASADPTFTHGATLNGTMGGNVGDQEPGETFTTFVRYQDTPSSFACRYTWQLDYDPFLVQPIDVVRADLPAGDFGFGSLFGPQLIIPDPPLLCEFCTAAIAMHIIDEDFFDPYQPLLNPGFFSSSNQIAELQIRWLMVQPPLSDPIPSIIAGAGGFEVQYDGVGSCILGVQIETSMAPVQYTAVPEPSVTMSLLAGALALFGLKRRKT